MGNISPSVTSSGKSGGGGGGGGSSSTVEKHDYTKPEVNNLKVL